MLETSLTRFGMILDSIQSDVMQVNKRMKKFLIEMEGIFMQPPTPTSAINQAHFHLKPYVAPPLLAW